MTSQTLPECTCPSGNGSLRWPCPAHGSAAADLSQAGAPPAVVVQASSFRVMNMALCIFDQSWSLDGDYLRCRACRSRQLTNYANEPFEHAPGCELADVLPARPWLELLRILAPMFSTPVAATPAFYVNKWELDNGGADGVVAMRVGRFDAQRQFFTVPLYLAPAARGIDMEPFRLLVEGCEAEFTGAETEELEPDDSKVSYPEDSCNITFGMIRNARKALDASPKGGNASHKQRAKWREVRGLAAGIVKNLKSFAEAKPNDWCGALDDSLDFADLIEKQADVQATSAEVGE